MNIDKKTAHSGLSPVNWQTQLNNPLLWSSKIDPTGIEHKNLREKLNGQTEDCPAGVDGDLLFNALLMFANWLAWQVAMPGLACDRQYLHEFVCKSGYDRSVAMAIAFGGIVFGVWGIGIDIQYMSFQDGANEGHRAPHSRVGSQAVVVQMKQDTQRYDTQIATHVNSAKKKATQVKYGGSLETSCLVARATSKRMHGWTRSAPRGYQQKG